MYGTCLLWHLFYFHRFSDLNPFLVLLITLLNPQAVFVGVSWIRAPLIHRLLWVIFAALSLSFFNCMVMVLTDLLLEPKVRAAAAADRRCRKVVVDSIVPCLFSLDATQAGECGR